MSAPLTARLAASVAFTSQKTLARVMGDMDPFGSLQSKIDAVALMKSDAEMRMAKYMSRVEMDSASASRAMVKMDAWRNDWGPSLESYPPNSTLPSQAQPRLPQEEAKSWISSIFFDGVYGFQFYQNGTIRKKIMDGEWTVAQADADLEARKLAFQTLTALDEDGAIARAYGQGPVGSLGLEPTTVAIIITAIVVAAFFVNKYLDNRASRAETLSRFDKMCEEARASKDTDPDAKRAYEKCLEAVKPPEQPMDPINLAVYLIGGVMALYVFGYYVAPKWIAYAKRSLCTSPDTRPPSETTSSARSS